MVENKKFTSSRSFMHSWINFIISSSKYNSTSQSGGKRRNARHAHPTTNGSWSKKLAFAMPTCFKGDKYCSNYNSMMKINYNQW